VSSEEFLIISVLSLKQGSITATDGTHWDEQTCCIDTFHDVSIASRL